MRKIRFNLRVLILSVTVVAVLLGARQYRINAVSDLCAQLEEDFYLFSLPNEWRDKVWQRKPTVGKITVVDGKEYLQRIAMRSGADYWGQSDDPVAIARLKQLGVVEYR
jgi:hypothetical protein